MSAARRDGERAEVHAPGKRQEDEPSPGAQEQPPLQAVGDAPGPVRGEGPPCTCGHGRTAHEHYRRGTDCALCTCARFRKNRPLLDRLRGR
jgi:hypothetical protein